MLHDDKLPANRRDMVFVFMFAAVIFFIHLCLTLRWQSYGAFEQWNVIFDADPNAESKTIAHGWSLGNFNHPLLPYFVSIPLRLLSGIAEHLGLISNQEVFRENIALGVPAFSSATKVICIYFTFRILHMPHVEALLSTSICALSFSSLVFGSTPSSYALSGAAIALITLCSAALSQQSTFFRKGGASVAAVFAIGTTVSNVIHYGWMLWATFTCKGYRYLNALVQAVLIAGFALLVSLLLSLLIGLAREGSIDSQRLILSDKFVNEFKPSHMVQLENAARFPETLARAYIPTTPLKKPNVLALKNDDPIKFELSFNGIDFGLGSIALWIIGSSILMGALVGAGLGETWRLFSFASTASILTTGALFSWFGTNTFLYSQYWQVPAAMLIGTWVYFFSKNVKYGRILIGALTVVLAIANLLVLSRIDAALAQSVVG